MEISFFLQGPISTFSVHNRMETRVVQMTGDDALRGFTLQGDSPVIVGNVDEPLAVGRTIIATLKAI